MQVSESKREAYMPLQPAAERCVRERLVQPGEQGLADVQQRVARALAAVERREMQEHWATDFVAAQQAGFIPSTRLLALAGIATRPLLVQRLVQRVAGGSAAEIDEAREHARAALARGIGVTLDVSALPPRAAAARMPAELDLVQALRRLDLGASSTAGARPVPPAVACNVLLRIDHPDFEAALRASRGAGAGSAPGCRLVAVLSDAFMRALRDGAMLPLVHAPAPAEHGGVQRADGQWVYGERAARALWRRLTRHAFVHGEPTLIFADALARDDNAPAPLSDVASGALTSGLLTEPPGSGCIDLGRLVQRPFGNDAAFDGIGFARLVRTAVRMLDNASSIAAWPAFAQAQEREHGAARRIGLGLTGLADALVMLGLRYDEEPARAWAHHLARLLRDAAYGAAVDLAIERGAYPRFGNVACIGRPHAAAVTGRAGFVSRLSVPLQGRVLAHGLRHAQLISIPAPQEASQACTDHASPGIEPVRWWRGPQEPPQRNGATAPPSIENRTENRAWRLYRHLHGARRPLTRAFVTAAEIAPQAQVAMLGAVTPYVDGVVASHIVLARDTPYRSAEQALEQAWAAGAKSIGLAHVAGSG